jgi:prepilin-type N-terminal cleavage/methylation domain-containing protein
MTHLKHRAFTLVEILIVVVILGILAAIVVPSLAGAVEGSAVSATYTDLQKIRRALGVYQTRNEGQLPPIVDGDGQGAPDGAGPWGPLVSNQGEYFLNPPLNAYVGGANGRKVVVVSGTPVPAFDDSYGWIYDESTGEVWASGFDLNDEPLPRP